METKLTASEREVLHNLAVNSYSQEALKQLAGQEFADASHLQYIEFRAELKRLMAGNTDPGNLEAQELARSLMELNHRRAQGNPEILEGMKQAWENLNALPDDAKPQVYALSTEEQEFIKQAYIMMAKQSSNLVSEG